MFNKNFYPTPSDVAELMTQDLNLENKMVYEPHGGKGDLISFLQSKGATVITSEIDADLALISRKKADRFIQHDFLNVQAHEITHIDFIIANPPFDQGDKHLLHAYEIAPYGCEIRFLLNANTIENPHTKTRKQLLTLIRDFGTTQNIGEVFKFSERQTSVQTAFVTLKKQGEKIETEWGDFFESEDSDKINEGEGILEFNAVRELVQRYIGSCELYKEVCGVAVRMNKLNAGLSGKLTLELREDEVATTYENYKKKLQAECWRYVFKMMNMDKYMNEELKKELNTFIETQSEVPFTMKNIFTMVDMVVQTHSQRMDRVLVKTFEGLTTYYHENRKEVEGWKTNSNYMLKKKFILPYIVEPSWSNREVANLKYGTSNLDKLEDFIKCLHYLSGSSYNYSNHSFYNSFTNYLTPEQLALDPDFRAKTKKKYEQLQSEGHKSKKTLEEFIVSLSNCKYEKKSVKVQFGKWQDSKFFEFKCFKKGTIHFKFKDDSTWITFNKAIVEIKGLSLPATFK